MAAAVMAARAHMLANGEIDAPHARSDSELLAEALAEEKARMYNPHKDASKKAGPVAAYVRMGNFCEEFITGRYEAYFNGFVLGCIMAAGVLVGLQTYGSFDENSPLFSPGNAWVATVDNLILYVFTVECYMKIHMEGTAPWRFFSGAERKWNCFDFVVVVLCYPFAAPLTGGNAAVLRLMRLARLMKLLKKIPQLQMIVMGLAGGLSSIVYIVILLLLVFYLYAIVGVMYFKTNDPWHFGTLHVAMITLFRAATLEDWTEIMYVNIFGCEEYPYLYCVKNNPEDCPGVPPTYWCATYDVDGDGNVEAGGTGVGAAVYWVTFVVVSALVMLSLFVGAVTMAMSESMADMKVEQEEAETKERLLKKQKRMDELAAKGAGQSTATFHQTDTANLSIHEREQYKSEAVMRNLLLEAWSGVAGAEVKMVYAKGLKGQYQALAEKADNLANNKQFVNFVTLVIITAGVMVGLQTYSKYAEDPVLNVIDLIILAIFTFEVILKFVAEEFAPWNFFKSAWNSFDFVVVAGSFLPAAGSLVTMLRLLRLLRVLKLVKSLPALAVIVEALIMGMSSIGFIGIILGLCFYLFAILGMILFKENDPWHFGSLHTSILTLFRCATGEDWTDVMYINIYGCGKVPWTDQYGGSWNESRTEANDPKGDDNAYPWNGLSADDDYFNIAIDWTGATYIDQDKESVTYGDYLPCQYANYPGKSFTAAIFFIVFMLLGSLVLLTLFIGVICTAMDEAQQAQKDEEELEERIKTFALENEINPVSIESYRKVFSMLDIDAGGSIEEDELRTGLKSVGQDPSPEEMAEIMKAVDEDESGEIDLAEFVEFMHKMKLDIAKKASSSKLPLNTVEEGPVEFTPVKAFDSEVAGTTSSEEGEERKKSPSPPPAVLQGNWETPAAAKYVVKSDE